MRVLRSFLGQNSGNWGHFLRTVMLVSELLISFLSPMAGIQYLWAESHTDQTQKIPANTQNNGHMTNINQQQSVF